jgi:hypothetical protein
MVTNPASILLLDTANFAIKNHALTKLHGITSRITEILFLYFVVGLITRLRARRSRNWGLVPGRDKRSSHRQNVQTGSGILTDSNTMGTGSHSLREHNGRRVKLTTHTPPTAGTAMCHHDVHRGNFTVIQVSMRLFSRRIAMFTTDTWPLYVRFKRS